MFDRIDVVPQPDLQIKTHRRANFCVFEINNIRIGLDTWDTPLPSAAYLEGGEFECGRALGDLDLLIKIQWKQSRYWRMFQRRCRIPITPWVMFPSSTFPLAYFSWEPNGHRYLANALGRPRRRSHWHDYFRKNEGIAVGMVQFSEYLEIVRSCKWNLILAGKMAGGDGKNRRETEGLSCGMPLAMNYRPSYPFPFVEGTHYVYVDTPESVCKLDRIDPVPFAAASRRLWEEIYEPKAMASLLFRLIRERTAHSSAKLLDFEMSRP
ncbi:MAG: hypothetical protein K8T89_10570 [Planctomycetes bacterium]|nr:hypothetical protein [Planctomycetota bacterium]